MLDGEIVAMSGGRPDMQALLSRLQTGSGRIPPPGVSVPVTYIVFDILEKDKKPLIDLPFLERRRLLKQAVAEGPHVILSVPVEGRGEDYFHAAVAKGLEGIMAKRKDSPYEPGLRSGAWLKVKGQKTCDCVIAGYTVGKGGRSATFGASSWDCMKTRMGMFLMKGTGGHDGSTLLPACRICRQNTALHR